MRMKQNGGIKSILGLALALGLGWVMQAGAQVTVTQVVESTTGPYGLAAGEETQVDILVYLAETVTSVSPAVDGGSLYPRVRLRVSPTTGYAVFQSRVGANGLLFRYMVRPGDFAEDMDAFSVNGLELGPSTIVTSGGTAGPYQSFNLPSGGGNSLSDNGNINIRTVAFTTPPATDIPVYSIANWRITRDASGVGVPVTSLMSISVQSPPSPPSGGNVSYPSSVVISNNLREVNFPVQGLNAGGPFTFRLRPAGYPTNGAGDLVVSNVMVTPGASPTFSISAPMLPLVEGVPPVAETHSCTVTLSQPAFSNVVITLTSSDPGKLQIMGSGQVTIAAGQSQAIFLVQALDGPASVTVGGTASHTYVLGTPAVVATLNVDPVLNNPPEGWELLPGSDGFPVTFSWSGTDVPADRPTLYVIVSFGDGTDSGPIVGQLGSVNHTYSAPGNRTVTITMYDKDGGTASRSAQIEIVPSTQVLITERIYGVQPGFRGLPGLGMGTIDDDDTLTAKVSVGGRPNVWRIKYSPTAPSTTLIATPSPLTITTNTFDSFFHVWVGDGFVNFDATEPIANEVAALELDGVDRDVSGVFSREFAEADNYGDIDLDALPDRWEQLWWPGQDLFHTPNRMDNPDEDFLPIGANATLAYPATSRNYAPYGAAFGNVLEVRGLDLGLNALNSDPSGPLDEPRYEADTREFFGTDPTIPDTDEDGMGDGWEYYFWMNAAVRGVTGVRYDPMLIYQSFDVIPADEIAAAFHPLIPGGGGDLDGDGLSDLEEYALGTDPIHWDTDGDGMLDGWEVYRGLNPFVADGAGNPDGDYMAARGWNPTMLRTSPPGLPLQPLLGDVHYRVYDAVGFDPRTGWGASYTERDRGTGFPQPNTTAMLNIDEYAIMRFWVDEARMPAGIPATPEAWALYSSNPLNCDTDGDGAPDGWEAYVHFDPCLPQALPAWDLDGDGLLLPGEFGGQETPAAAGGAVTATITTNETTWVVTYVYSEPVPMTNPNDRWWNKFWPTDPNNMDTDGDYITDSGERGLFLYDPPAEWSTAYIRGSRAGGGLNPCSVDTDMDFIPDTWEVQYAFSRTSAQPPPARDTMARRVQFMNTDGTMRPVEGMDGTIFDSKSGETELTGQYENYDFDGDGLENFQEYYANAMWHFNYDKWVAGLGAGGYDPASLFQGRPKGWDWAIAANYWQIMEGAPPPFHTPFIYIEPEPRPLFLAYASADPSLWDSDFDGMDDHYEMYYGLNPLLSETRDYVSKGIPARNPDIRVQPWIAGEALADPDQDGIPNWEEAIFPGRPAPYNLHTDPSPYWVTDVSYEESWVNLYYRPGSQPWYWGSAGGMVFPYPAIPGLPPSYLYSFANTEGFDTDNDNIPDKMEVTGADQVGTTNPGDFDSPRLRKALYLDGQSAARNRFGASHDINQLRSWTVELWARPEQPQSPTGSRQILIERPVQLWSTDPMPAPELVRRNFRIGLEANGMPFAEYNNSGNDVLTETIQGTGYILQSNQWYHVAATMDGLNQQFTIYVNGVMVARKTTALIPATGVIDGNPPLRIPAPIVVGAADRNPYGRVEPSVPGLVTPPDLHSQFKGWVDEIRVWDGVRTQDHIKSTQMQRFGIDDVTASMTNYAAAVAAATNLNFNPPDMLYGQAGNLPAVVLYHYTFDNLPDPTYEPVSPQGFDLLNGRPSDGTYPGVPWWWQAQDRSRVYSDYLFVHWAENTPSHVPALPQFNRFGTVSNYVFGIAPDSPFWTSNAPPGTFEYRNRTYPAHLTYQTSDTRMTESWRDGRGLLPLWYARADMDVPLWDNGTPGTVGFDSNGDGIPDWWYIRYGFDPFGASIADNDDDSDGISNYWEYRLGTDPNNVYSSDPTGTRTDAEWDTDGDGLSNADELNIHGTDPSAWDTDDDGVGDGAELDPLVAKADGQMITSPVHSRSPFVQRSLLLDGIGVTVPRAGRAASLFEDRFELAAWTVEAWIQPTDATQTGSVIRRLATDGRHTFDLRLDNNVPSIRFTSTTAESVLAGGTVAIPAGEWTHLAGTWDPASKSLSLYVNGLSYRAQTTFSVPYLGAGSTTLGAGLQGHLDEVRIWGAARSATEIADAFNTIVDTPKIAPALVANYRFDDGGITSEDFRNPLDWDYALRANAFDETDVPVLFGDDDFNGNGIADWWEWLYFGYMPGVAEEDEGVSAIDGLSALPANASDTLVWREITLPLTEANDVFGNATVEEDVYLIKDVTVNLDGLGLPAGAIIDRLDYEVVVTDMFGLNNGQLRINNLESDNRDPTTPNDGLWGVISWSRAVAFTHMSSMRREDGDLFWYENLKPGHNRLALRILDNLGSTAKFDMYIKLTGVRFRDGIDTEAVDVRVNRLIVPLGSTWFLSGANGQSTEPLQSTTTTGGDNPVVNNYQWYERYYGMNDEERTAAMALGAFDEGGDVDDGSVDLADDPENDGLTNLYEYHSGTNPKAPDTDNDGRLDRIEDYDGDGLQNLREQDKGTDPMLPDTADNGLLDGAAGDPVPANSLIPLVDRVLTLDGAAGSFAEMPRQMRFALPEFTVQAWVNPSAGGGDIIARQVQSGVFNYALRLRADRRVELAFTPGDLTADVVLTVMAGNELPLNAWTHVAGTFNASNGTLRIYLDGAQAASLSTVKRPAVNGVGPVWTRAGAGFAGMLDEVAIFGSSMDAATISSMLDGVAPAMASASNVTVVSYYQFDDGTSASGPDANGRHYGTSGRTDWYWGQVEDFAGGYEQDWKNDWRNAGTLRGGVAMVAAPVGAPVQFSLLDTDGDGMPDWWELMWFGSATGADPAADPDGDGVSNYWEFRLGSDPNNPYSLDPSGNLKDSAFDSDGDGLSNADELNIHGTDPSAWDTDDDGVGDGAELDPLVAKADGRRTTSPVYSRSPLVQRSLALDGAAIVVPAGPRGTDRFNLGDAWTLEAWVRPASAAETGSVIVRTTTDGSLGFELRLDANVPTVRFRTAGGQIVHAGGSVALPSAEWSHLAGVWDASANSMSLYVNGMAYRAQHFMGTPWYGSVAVGATRIGGGLVGHLDELRIWNGARTAEEIADNYQQIVSTPWDIEYNHDARALVAYYRFDDGGLSSEDYRRTLDWDYALQGTVMVTDPAVVVFGMDDQDGDALPDWWQGLHFPTYLESFKANTNKLNAVKASNLRDGWRDANAPIGSDFSVLQAGQYESVWMIKDAFLGLPSDATLWDAWGTPKEITFSRWGLNLFNSRGKEQRSGEVFINGERVLTFKYVPRTGNYSWRLDFVKAEGIYIETYSSDFMFITGEGYLKLGRNRIAIRFDNEVTNLQDADQAVDVEFHSISFRVAFKDDNPPPKSAYLESLIEEGSLWSIYGRNSSTKEPPIVLGLNLEEPNVPWSDEFYGTTPADVAGFDAQETLKIMYQPLQDPERDGLSNLYEYWIDANPLVADTDNDGRLDGLEDADGDGLSNFEEQRKGTHPMLRDTADNGSLDGAAGDPQPANSLVPMVNRVLQLRGSISDYIAFPRHQRFARSEFTLQAWVKPAVGGGDIIARQVQSSVFNYALRLRADRRVEMAFTPGDLTADVVLTVPVDKALALNAWSHVAGTFDADNGMMRIYLGGIQVASLTTVKRPAVNGVGPVWTRAGSGFAGMLDEVAIFGSEVDAATITSTLEGIAPTMSDGLNTAVVSYYQFDDGTSASGPDANGRHYGTSGRADWYWGQVQDFAGGFDRDWLNDWRNAGTLFGGVTMVNAPADAPVRLTLHDSNSNGIPDWWEDYYFPDRDPVLGDVWADPDSDGLSNYAEYLAGTDPWNADSAGDGFADYDSRANVYSLTWGELHNDGDGMPEAWESLNDATAPNTGKNGPDIGKYDGQFDPDEDGWSNLAEYLGRFVNTNGVLTRSPSPIDVTQYPMPELRVRLRYSGALGANIDTAVGAARPVQVFFHRTPGRDGHPAGRLEMTTGTVLTRALTEGHLVEGTNYVFAFMDANNNGRWDTDWTNNYSEPAGIAMVDVGWADGMEVEVELTHEPKGYWRFTWEPVPDALGYTVELKIGSTVVHRRSIVGGDRTFFHEGDYQTGGLLGLQNATYTALIYARQDFYGVEPDLYHTFAFRKNTNTVSTASVPLIVTPAQGGELIHALNTFAWKMDPYATRYQVEIAATNAAGGVGGTLLTTAPRLRPSLDPDGNYSGPLPFLAGDTGNVGQSWSNGTYWMRVRGLSDNGNTQYSAWRSFKLNVNPPEAGGKSAIDGTLYYFGRVQRGYTNSARYAAGETNLHIIVQAFRNAAFAGEPAGQVQVNAVHGGVGSPGFMGAYTLRGLPPGVYYLRAFIDMNGNRRLDPFDPWNMLRTGGLGGGYDPQSVDVSSPTGVRASGQRIVLRDHDTDSDGLADAWEYSWMGTLAHGALDDPYNTGSTLLEKYLASGVLLFSPLSEFTFSPAVSDRVLMSVSVLGPEHDSDGDGMSDLDELIFARTDPNDVDDVLRLLAQTAVIPATGGLPGESRRIVWQGKAGVRYVVRSSADLVTWQHRAEFEGAGTHVFEETDGARTRQFYVVEIR